MDVFEAFPKAIISGLWEIGTIARGTEIGKVFTPVAMCDVIVEEGVYDVTDRSPSAEYQDSDTLLYAMPGQMPTLDTAVLANGYVWHNTGNDLYYEIRECSQGKNQATGEVEHIEFLLRPTEVAEDEQF